MNKKNIILHFRTFNTAILLPRNASMSVIVLLSCVSIDLVLFFFFLASKEALDAIIAMLNEDCLLVVLSMGPFLSLRKLSFGITLLVGSFNLWWQIILEGA